MTVITALLSALLGGVLVMAGDYVRRRVERRQDALNNLVEASAHLSSVYNRLCGELIDAAERAVPALTTCLPWILFGTRRARGSS